MLIFFTTDDMSTLAWIVGAATSASLVVWLSARVWLPSIAVDTVTLVAGIVGGLLGAWPSLRHGARARRRKKGSTGVVRNSDGLAPGHIPNP